MHSSFRKQSLLATEMGASCCGMEGEQLDYVLALVTLPIEMQPRAKLDVTILVIEESKSHIEPSSSKKEGLVLKQLPEHLRYAFLGGQSEFPVIILSLLCSQEEEKLLEVLRRHKSALAWSIVDSNEISLTICMHKILMEESFKPSIKHQRRLKLAMKEVV